MPAGCNEPQMGGRRRRSHRRRSHHKKSSKRMHKRGARKTHRKRRVRRGGGGLFGAAKTALVPFTLFKAQKHMQKRSRKSARRTRKR